MEQWKILVLGTLRLGLNADYDRILELANQHTTIRQMLGHGDWADERRYSLQTLEENLRLLTPEILDRINQVVVRAGHQLVKKSPEEGLNARADSFVVETDVHYPTDLNLLLDAVRKAIETCAQLCQGEGLSDWRQSKHNLRKLKRLYRRLQSLKRSSAKDPDKRAARQGEIEQACREYLALAEDFLARARDTRATLHIGCDLPAIVLAELDQYIAYGELLSDQIRRRILGGERIPHEEKIFSIFEPHTEWISKGKAGVPVELGLRVAICEDQHGFILYHQVMHKSTDDQIAVPLIQETCARFPEITSVSRQTRAFTARPTRRDWPKSSPCRSCLRKASAQPAKALVRAIPNSFVCVAVTALWNRPSTPWRHTDWTSVAIMGSTASSAT
jgi:hypothetical protein